MGKITSKYQVSIPKALAERLGVGPGDEIEWHLAGKELRVTPVVDGAVTTNVDERLRSFDEATKRQAKRRRGKATAAPSGRGWTREELYVRGRTR